MPRQRQQMVLLSAGASLPRSTCPRRPRETRGGRGGEGRPSGDEAPYPPQNGRNSNRLAALARLGCSAGLQLGWAGLGCGLGFLALGHHFDQNDGNQSYFSVLGHHFDANNNNKSYFLALGHHFEPKQRKYMILLGTDASLRGENNDNKSYFLALGHHFEAKTRATSRTS